MVRTRIDLRTMLAATFFRFLSKMTKETTFIISLPASHWDIRVFRVSAATNLFTKVMFFLE